MLPYVCDHRRICARAIGAHDRQHTVTNLNPLKYCFHGQHAKPRATFRILPGAKGERAVCAECYDEIVAERAQKRASEAVRALP
jgi:hypothetical protein